MTGHDASTPGGEEILPASDVDPVEQLAHLLPALWRVTKQGTRSGEALPPNESQVTILRLVIHHGGLSPARLAEIMHLARPTVSNLLKDLVGSLLVERRTSTEDARVVTIVPTEAGRRVLETFRTDRTTLLRHGLEAMPEGERAAILGAIRPLRLLLREIEVGSAEPAEERTA